MLNFPGQATQSHLGDLNYGQSAISAARPLSRFAARTVAGPGLYLVSAPQGPTGLVAPYEIGRLPSLQLRISISARLSYADGEWVAEAADLPLYGSGETATEAKEMLAREIESLWDDLNVPGEFADQWKPVRQFLRRVIA